MSQFTTSLVVELKGGTYWEVIDGFKYYLSDEKDSEGNFTSDFIEIPKGFTTDFASIPKVLKIFFSDHDIYNKAAVVHDYLYFKGLGFTREEADTIFCDAMIILGVDSFTANTMYTSVRLFGASRWNELRS